MAGKLPAQLVAEPQHSAPFESSVLEMLQAAPSDPASLAV
jgi:hypothetical protein